MEDSRSLLRGDGNRQRPLVVQIEAPVFWCHHRAPLRPRGV